jgi:hypothetical protein
LNVGGDLAVSKSATIDQSLTVGEKFSAATGNFTSSRTSTGTGTGALTVVGGMGVGNTIMGNQPYIALISATNHITFGAVTTIPDNYWTTITTSNGMTYSSGVITVPVTGIYYVNFQMGLGVSVASTITSIGLKTNGSSTWILNSDSNIQVLVMIL